MGMGGVEINHIAVERSTMVGMQSPNQYVGVKESRDRVTLPTLKVLGSEGCKVVECPVYDCDPIDTSWLAYGGKETLGVGNKYHIRVGGGGIYTETIGPIMTDGEISINNAKKGFFIQTKLFQLFAQERAMLSGGRLDLDFNETYIKGNVGFFNNVTFNGGVYVNGELMCNHLTTQKQMNVTEFNEDIKTFINPSQSFHVFQGYSQTAKKYAMPSLLGTAFGTMDATDIGEQQCWIEAELAFNTDFIEQIIPGLGSVGLDVLKFLLAIPIKLKFPKGISLISDGTDAEHPEAYMQLVSRPRTFLDGIKASDTSGCGHTHAFAGPACNYIKGTDNMYQEATKINAKEPLEHKQTISGGANNPKEALNQTTEAAKKQAETYFKKTGKEIIGLVEDN